MTSFESPDPPSPSTSVTHSVTSTANPWLDESDDDLVDLEDVLARAFHSPAVPHHGYSTYKYDARTPELSLHAENFITSIPVTKEHEHWHLVQHVMLGISISINRISSFPFSRPVNWKEYKEVVKIKLPVIPGNFNRYKFKDYAPLVFQSIRNRFGIPEQDFLNSLCSSNKSLRLMPTPGKSGSKFYWSHDFRYVLKTISRSESLFLREILFPYYQHMLANPHSLLPWFLGHYRIDRNGHKSRFVVMRNVFDTPLKIHEQYDLKGSTHAREVHPSKANEPGVTFKDNDYIKRRGVHSIKLGKCKKRALMTQISVDCSFLTSINIMDYSLLLGIHHYNYQPFDEITVPNALFGASRPPSPSPLKTSYSVNDFYCNLDQLIPVPQPCFAFPPLSKAYLCQASKAPAFLAPSGVLVPMFQLEEGGFASVRDGPTPISPPRRPPKPPSRPTPPSITIPSPPNHRKSFSSLPSVMKSLPVTSEVERRISMSSTQSSHSSESWVQPVFVTPPAAEPEQSRAVRRSSVSSNESIETSASHINPLHGLDTIRGMCERYEQLSEEDAQLPRGDEVYFFGIIDILQKFNTRKKFESSAKGLFANSETISCLPPEQYASRFIRFIDRVVDGS
ncbi:hypothetical protein RCL1_004097 [Eukaryota sp. TZLM3-RCL]